MTTIDLNADLGEGFGRWELGDDSAMLEIVTSANVACGFHAGDPALIRATAAEATERGVAIGAHVSYRDLAGFGRRYVDASPAELSADVIYQLGALRALAAASGGQVRYVKPHGALYNTIAADRRHADAVIEAMLAAAPTLPLVVLAGSPLAGWARDAGLRAVPEAFADRAYEPDGTLVDRRSPGAVLHDADEVADRMLELVETGTLAAIDGSRVGIVAESVCVHGDSAGAVQLAGAVRRRLESSGVSVRAFASGVG